MTKLQLAVIAFAALLVLSPLVYAFGYGTSSISFAQGSLNLMAGASGSVGYTVNLASGSTWGTDFVIADQSQLASEGIMVRASAASGDPPYSGTLSVSLGSGVSAGKYSIVAMATGDDPSSGNATLTLNVAAAQTTVQQTTTVQAANGANGTTTAQPKTTIIPTPAQSVNGTAYPTVSYQPAPGSGLGLIAGALIIIILIVTGYLVAARKAMPVRLTLIGVALILIGIVAWLYGDYSGGNLAYIWGGVAAIVIGTLVWIYADAISGTFKSAGSMAAILGIILIIVGTAIWLYGDYYAGGNMAYIWGGVVLLIVGTAVWLYAYRVVGKKGKK
ncbi:MAG: hypothetical protein KGH61_04410 [Candidatus Micrarchaeota archaeon]|nr:hypothetical protein [Candidatus Micrarchaeota archaeon]MDE1848161.1 hypothetical protein [Candidatus Micrarchaeota archaeon]MDE1864651.1 hypothetical protein [Candidatus Micrarchaeota archaeon]